MTDDNKPETWEEWLKAAMGNHPALPERIRAMYRMYGSGPEGATCKTCKFLYRIKYAKAYLKCSLTKLTHGPGTDWRASWPACGKYEKEKK